ncbi:MAG: hypothetical protein Tsb0016_21160 [Sphingomonadales bacterium]
MIDERIQEARFPGGGGGRYRERAESSQVLSKMSLAVLMDLGMSPSRIAAYANLSIDEVKGLMQDYGL